MHASLAFWGVCIERQKQTKMDSRRWIWILYFFIVFPLTSPSYIAKVITLSGRMWACTSPLTEPCVDCPPGTHTSAMVHQSYNGWEVIYQSGTYFVSQSIRRAITVSCLFLFVLVLILVVRYCYWSCCCCCFFFIFPKAAILIFFLPFIPDFIYWHSSFVEARHLTISRGIISRGPDYKSVYLCCPTSS